MPNHPLHISAKPRICGAKTRSGNPCKTAPVSGKKRCRMHGGAKGSGATIGNINALKHGKYSARIKAMRKEANDMARAFKELKKQFQL